MRVEVSLQHLSSPDPGPVSSTSMGRQPPSSWAISSDPASVELSGAYVLTAKIFVAGRVAYRTTVPVAVTTRGAPTSGVQLIVAPPDHRLPRMR